MEKKFVLGAIGVTVQDVGIMLPPAGPIVASVGQAGLQSASAPTLETLVDFGKKVLDLNSKLSARN